MTGPVYHHDIISLGYPVLSSPSLQETAHRVPKKKKKKGKDESPKGSEGRDTVVLKKPWGKYRESPTMSFPETESGFQRNGNTLISQKRTLWSEVSSPLNPGSMCCFCPFLPVTKTPSQGFLS